LSRSAATTKRHRAKLDASDVVTAWKRQRRTGQHLPEQARRAVEKGKALLKEAKGLGR
jgi:hypothetical protein